MRAQNCRGGLLTARDLSVSTSWAVVDRPYSRRVRNVIE